MPACNFPAYGNIMTTLKSVICLIYKVLRIVNFSANPPVSSFFPERYELTVNFLNTFPWFFSQASLYFENSVVETIT